MTLSMRLTLLAVIGLLSAGWLGLRQQNLVLEQRAASAKGAP